MSTFGNKQNNCLESKLKDKRTFIRAFLEAKINQSFQYSRNERDTYIVRYTNAYNVNF